MIESNNVTVTVSAPAPVLGSLSLTVSPTAINTGGTADFTATALDTNGQPYAGASLSLVDNTTGQIISMGTTNASGVVSVSVTFNSAGTYTLYAED